MGQVEREEIALRAGEARMLMGHSMLQEAFAAVEQRMVDHIKTLKFGPAESDVIRDKLMMGLQVVDQVKDQIQEHIETGKITSQLNTEGY